ncbi:MAG: cytochrome c, class I [Sphingobacteriia bacterium]|nr:cytochrome c, class I [Sphingobacteriia bacterium]NCC39711.1 cytochrome c, class I [Gammaproteobacteria bacterium]
MCKIRLHAPLVRALSAASLLICLNVSFADDGKIAGLAATCNNCHGMDGVSAGSSMASIAGQSREYLETLMLEWQSGERFSTTMGRLLAGYSNDEIIALAAYFAEKPWVPAVQELDAKLVRSGKFATERCAKCHGETGAEPDGEDTPRLDGQWLRHLELETLKYRDESITLPHKKMTQNMRKIKEKDVPAVSVFYASQTGGQGESE